MAIAVGVSPTRAIAPVYEVRAPNFITYNSPDDGADRTGYDGSYAGADADAFNFASRRGSGVANSAAMMTPIIQAVRMAPPFFNENDQTTHGCATMFPFA